MRKLIVIATALSMMLPFPILAQEEMNEEPSQQIDQPEPMTLESEESKNFFCSFNLRCVFEDGTDTIDSIDIYKYDLQYEGLSFPIEPKDYILLFPKQFLRKYEFKNLPTLQASDFTSEGKEIDLTVTLRNKLESLDSLNSNVPIVFNPKYPSEEVYFPSFTSSFLEVNASLSNGKVNIDRQKFNSKRQATTKKDNYRLNESSLSADCVYPVKNGTEILAYVMEPTLRVGTYEELKNSDITLKFSNPKGERGTYDFNVPLHVLFPSVADTYSLNSQALKKASEYINNAINTKTTQKDENSLLIAPQIFYWQDYNVSFTLKDSQEYSLKENEINVNGTFEFVLTPKSEVHFCLTLKNGTELQNNGLEKNGRYGTLSEILDDNSNYSFEKLQEYVKDEYSFWYPFQVSKDFSLNPTQHYSLEDLNEYEVIQIAIPIDPLTSEQQNEILYGFEFIDDNLSVGVGWSGERKWKDWFANPAQVSDTLTNENINQDYLKQSISEGFELVNSSFAFSVYDYRPYLPIQSKTAYSLNNAELLDWNELDEEGNPVIWVKYNGQVLWESSDYTATYTQTSRGSILCEFTGIRNFSGSITYEYFPTQETEYVVEFIDSANNQVIKTVSLPNEWKLFSPLSTYLEELPNEYAYSKKPDSLISFDFVTQSKNNKRVQTAKIKITSLSDNSKWIIDEGAKITIPYTLPNDSQISGTLFLEKEDLEKISLTEAINNNLIGYEVVSLNDFKIISYATPGTQNTYQVLDYFFEKPISLTPVSGTSNSAEVKATVSLGDLKIDVPLASPSESNGSSSEYRLKADNLVAALKETVEKIAQQFIQTISDSVDSIASIHPNYEFSFEDRVENVIDNVVSKKIDLDSSETPTPKVKVKPESYIRLKLRKENQQVAEVMERNLLSDFTFMTLNEITEINETADEDEYILVKVSDVAPNGNLTAQSLSNYLKSRNLHVDSFASMNFNTPQDISSINSETGFFEVPVLVQEGATTTTTYVRPKPKPQKPKPEEPAVQDPTTPITSSKGRKTMFRLFNRLTGEHFYTASVEEKNTLMANQEWNDEGQGWISPESSSYPVYRVFNPNSGEHHYTMDKNEYETLVSLGWNNEGLGWYSADDLENKIPLYRLYNPTAPEHAKHHYTTSLEERDHLLNTGEWNDEGIGWYGMPTE